MKKGILIFLTVLFCLGFAACSNQNTKLPVSETNTQNSIDVSENQSISLQEESSSSDTELSETGERKLTLTIDGQEFDVVLYDTPAANALYDMLPLELNFEDFNGIEKIAYMDSELPTENEPDGCDPDVGDLCLYAPWGNLSIFYNDFGYSNSLIKLGHIDSGMDTISNINSNFSAVLETAE